MLAATGEHGTLVIVSRGKRVLGVTRRPEHLSLHLTTLEEVKADRSPEPVLKAAAQRT